MVKLEINIYNNHIIYPNINNEIDGVCDDNGNVVEDSLRILNSDTKNFKFNLNNKKIHYSDDDVIFAGNLFPHYGHFILETLTCFWIFLKYDKVFFKNKKIIFIESVNKIESDDIFEHPLFKKIVKLLQLETINFKIQRYKIIKYRKVFVPTKIFRINDNIYVEKIYNMLVNSLCLSINNKIIKQTFDVIYVSRNCNIRIKNEDEIKACMNFLGIKIIDPNINNFEKDIYIYNHAKIMIGIEGTNLHNSIFMRKNNSTLISISSNRYFNETNGYISKNQYLCCKLRKCKLYTIDNVCDSKNIFDVKKIETDLINIFTVMYMNGHR